MKNLYLDENSKDLEIGTNDNLRFTQTNGEFVSQKIENKLLFFAGEWFLNYELGIPYLDLTDRRNKSKNFFVKNPDLNTINSILLNEISIVEGKDEILNFETSFNTTLRQYSVSFEVRVITGEIIQNEVTL